MAKAMSLRSAKQQTRTFSSEIPTIFTRLRALYTTTTTYSYTCAPEKLDDYQISSDPRHFSRPSRLVCVKGKCKLRFEIVYIACSALICSPIDLTRWLIRTYFVFIIQIYLPLARHSFLTLQYTSTSLCHEFRTILNTYNTSHLVSLARVFVAPAAAKS